MSSLATRLTLNLFTTLTGSTDDFGPDSIVNTFPFTEGLLTDGSGASQANKRYKGKLSITAGSSQTLDLYGGLTDPEGNTLNLTRIVAIAIRNANTVAGDNLEIGGAASHPWESWAAAAGSKEKVGPGGVWLKWEPSAAGMAVVNGTSDNLKIANPGASSILTVTGSPAGGTFTLTVTDSVPVSQTTATIAYNASAATMQSAIEALSNVGAGNVGVNGSAGGPWTVKFVSSLGAMTIALGTNSLTGGTSPTVTISANPVTAHVFIIGN